MNIVKIKDISHQDESINEIWDIYFRDKWCYYVQMNTLFPIKDPENEDSIGITPSQYIWLETNLQQVLEDYNYGIEYDIDLNTIPFTQYVDQYIDYKATCSLFDLNNIYTNNTLSDIELTEWDIKGTMINIAKMLYDIRVQSGEESSVLDMLSYYAGNKYNKTLSILEDGEDISSISSKNESCGCGNSNIIVNKNNSDITDSYERMMFDIMLSCFSSLSYWYTWRDTNPEALELIVSYLEGIKTYGFIPVMPAPIHKTKLRGRVDCNTVKTYNWKSDLECIINSFNYILSFDESNKNFTSQYLYKFAMYYPLLVWDIKKKSIIDSCTRLDLSKFYTKDETYSREEIDTKLEELEYPDVHLEEYYTKEEIDTKLEDLKYPEADFSDYYTKDEINTSITTEKLQVGTVHIYETEKEDDGVTVPAGYIYTDRGNIYTTKGNIYSTDGDIYSYDGDVFANNGKVYAEDDIYTKSGDFEAHNGSFYKGKGDDRVEVVYKDELTTNIDVTQFLLNDNGVVTEEYYANLENIAANKESMFVSGYVEDDGITLVVPLSIMSDGGGGIILSTYISAIANSWYMVTIKKEDLTWSLFNKYLATEDYVDDKIEDALIGDLDLSSYYTKEEVDSMFVTEESIETTVQATVEEVLSESNIATTDDNGTLQDVTMDGGEINF